MNRKQRVAIGIGVAAVVLLVLFPPWYDTHELGQVRLRWAWSDPVVVEEVEERVAYYHEFVNKYSGRDEETVPELRYDTRTKRVSHVYAITYGLAAAALLVVATLTVAAVFLLRDREP